MKKYLNGTNKHMCLEFQTFAQFLFRGQSVTTDETPKAVPEGVIVIELKPEPEEDAPKKKVSSRKRSVSKKVEED